MNIRQLEIFWAVMRTGTVTGAAQLLNISQPAVSKMLRHAEDQIHMQLFVRQGGKLQPTEKAEHLYVFADSIFSNVERMKQAMFDIRDSDLSRMQIVATPTIAEGMLAKPLTRLLMQYPRVNVSLKLLPTAQIINRVALQQADIGLLLGPAGDPSVEQFELCRVPMICAVNQSHPLANKPKITLGDLVGQRIISYHRYTPWGTLVWPHLEAAGVAPQSIVECNHAHAAFALVNANAGIAIIATSVGDAVYPDVVLRHLHPVLDATILYILPRFTKTSHLAKMLLNQLREDLASIGLIKTF